MIFQQKSRNQGSDPEMMSPLQMEQFPDYSVPSASSDEKSVLTGRPSSSYFRYV